VTQWSARLVPRIGLAPLTFVGSLLFGAGLLWRVLFVSATPAYATDLLPSMLISGIGVGLALSSFIAAGATALPADRAATASGTINSGRQIASSLGVAVLVTMLAGSGSAVHRFTNAWWVGIGLAVVAAVIGLGLLDRRSTPGGSGVIAGTGAATTAAPSTVSG
jgi:hypothetical protein